MRPQNAYAVPSHLLHRRKRSVEGHWRGEGDRERSSHWCLEEDLRLARAKNEAEQQNAVVGKMASLLKIRYGKLRS
jgi:hypothetical protein